MTTEFRLPSRILCTVFTLVAILTTGHCSPINRQAGISENVYITVQNDTYGNEHRVCSIESMTYEDGESIPTSSPCEHCICRPPGFACTIISCDYRPGCKALKRSNQCCPEYQCECEKDGKIYQNGEKILDDNNPCEVCYCQGGDVVCAVIDCYWRSDCQPRYIENRCCPLYDHCPPPSDVGPILPTTRPTTTTTTLPPISWFNMSQAIGESSSSKPLLSLTSSTTEVAVGEPQFVQHVVLIPTPVEQSPAENMVQGSTSAEQGSSSNEVPQASSEQESPQIIIQPNESGEAQQQEQEQHLLPAGGEPQPVPSSAEPATVEVHVSEPTESTLPVVAEGVTLIKHPELAAPESVPVSVPASEAPEIQDRTPDPEPVQPASVASSSEDPIPPAAPSVIYNEVQQGNEVVPPEVYPVPAAPAVVEPSETMPVSSSFPVEASSSVSSSFYDPITPSPVPIATEIEASEAIVESYSSEASPGAPVLVTGAQTHDQAQVTFTPISVHTQQIITITPTRSFMTELSTETVVHPPASASVVIPVQESIVPSVASAAFVEPSVAPTVVSGPPELVEVTTEVIETSEVPTTLVPGVPPPVELQVSVAVVSVPAVPAFEAPGTTVQPVVVSEVAEPEGVQDSVIEFEAPVTTIPSVIPAEPSSSPDSDSVEPTTGTVLDQEEPLDSFDSTAEQVDGGAIVATTNAPVVVELSFSSANPVDEKIVVIESQAVEPVTSPPEVVTASLPSVDDLDPGVAADDKSAPSPDAGTNEEIVTSTEASEKIVIIESGPVEPATSSPEEAVPTTVTPDSEALQNEKIVIIESGPVVPATSPPEVVTTLQPEAQDGEAGHGLADNEISDDGDVVENLVDVQEPVVSSSSEAPAASSTTTTTSTEEPTTHFIYAHDADDTIEISEPESLSLDLSDDGEAPPPTTYSPLPSSVEGVTNPPQSQAEVQQPSLELQPPVHDFQPRPDEENEIQDEVLVPEDAVPLEPVSLSQVKPQVAETHQQPSSVIFDPPLSLYLPVQDAVPTTTSKAPNTELPESYSDGEGVTIDSGLNELVFDPVPITPDSDVQGSDHVQTTTGSPVVQEPSAQDDDPVSQTSTAEPVSGPGAVSQDDPAGGQVQLQGETTTVPLPVADREEDTVEIALADDPEQQHDSEPTTVSPAVEEMVHDGVTTVQPEAQNDGPTAEHAEPLDIQFDPSAEASHGNAPTTTVYDHMQELFDGSSAGPTEVPDQVHSDATDLPPGSKYRLDLSSFEDEGSGSPSPESVTVVDAKHDLMHADEAEPTTSVSDLIADNLVVFDEPKVEPEKPVAQAQGSNVKTEPEVTTSRDELNDGPVDDSGSGSGDGEVPATERSLLSRHHHPDHVEGSGDDEAHTTDLPAPLSRHHHPDHIEGSGSGDGESGVTAADDDPEPTTHEPSYVNDIVPIPQSGAKSDSLPKIPPHLVKPVAPISPDMVESFSRADHSVQSEAETEVARADESWFWRTFNKIMTLPDYLRSSRRPRRSADSDNSDWVNTDKALHKKGALKQLKKAMGDPSGKKYKEWSLFPRFLLW